MTFLRPFLPGSLIDQYLLKELLRPLALSLTALLAALLMERILRLVDLIATQGGAFDAVLTMAANLLPHYLGLALPAAFFLSILLLVARLAEDSEIDALLSSGLSLRRIVLPFLFVGLVLALGSLALFGYVQPHARYGYRAALNVVLNSGWAGVVPSGAFVKAGDGVMFHAAEADSSGRVLSGILVDERRDGGRLATTTAAQGVLQPIPGQANKFALVLKDGIQIRVAPTGTVTELRFDILTLERELSLEGLLFRPRGRDQREMTLDELWRGVRTGEGEVPPRVMRGEFHGRLARAAAVVTLPILALPMGIAAKRRRRGAGVVLAAVILMLYHHLQQLGQGLVETGRLPPAIGIWLPFVAFVGFASWTLWRMNGRPGGGPLDEVLAAIERVMDAIGRFLARRAGRFG